MIRHLLTPLQRACHSLQFSVGGRWTMLLLASAVVTIALELLRIPAAPMLGPMIAAILIQQMGATVKVPHATILISQAVIGCLIAHSITSSFLSEIASHWFVLPGVVGLSLAASVAVGWTMGRLDIVPGSTGIWGMLPGGGTVMVVMSEAYGADPRLVAFMQYLRVLLVAAVASALALLFGNGGGGPFPEGYFPPADPQNLASTAAIALAGAVLGRICRLPAGTLLGPMALGAVLNVLGLVSIEIPPVLLVASFAVVGWTTGLRFTREVLSAAVRALPASLGAITVIMAFCGALAWMLVIFLHVDPLTAYLATSPGGLDAAAIIAASTKVDMSFVMTMQTFRIILLIVAGPYVARWAAGTLMPGTPVPELPKRPETDDLE